MDDDAFADNIYVRSGTYFPEVGRQFKATGAVFANRDIADVSEMEFTYPPFSVCDIRWIPVTARGFTVRCAAIAVFVDMNGVDAREMRFGISTVNVIWSSFCVKIAIPVTLLSLAGAIVAIACFADGVEGTPT